MRKVLLACVSNRERYCSRLGMDSLQMQPQVGYATHTLLASHPQTVTQLQEQVLSFHSPFWLQLKQSLWSWKTAKIRAGPSALEPLTTVIVKL